MEPDGNRPDRDVSADGEAETRIVTTFCQCFEREAGRDDVGAGATMLLGNGKSQQPELAESIPDLPIETTLDVALVCTGRNHGGCERLHRLVELELLGGMAEVHVATLCGCRYGEAVAADYNEMLEPVAFLLGTWRGKGEGLYPTIDAFSYEEEAVFGHTGRTFLVYSSKTWRPDKGTPMHSESGFIRVVDGDRLEMVVAHAFGITEISEGSVERNSFEVSSKVLTSSSTAKRVDGITRSVQVSGDELHYKIGMAFGGLPLQNHLSATLRRTP